MSTNHRLFYNLQNAPWTPSPYSIVILGITPEHRCLPLAHVADMVGTTQERILGICAQEPKVRRLMNSCYKNGFIYVESLPFVLRNLGWTEKDITKGLAMLSVEKGSLAKTGKSRTGRNNKTQKGEEIDEGEEEQEEEKGAFNPEKCIEEIKSYMGPDALIAFRSTPRL